MSNNLIRQRNSNIEALRVLAMAFIVISHYSVHSSIKSIDLGLIK